MTDHERILSPDALAVLNWYVHKQGHQPRDKYTNGVVTDEEWSKMSKDAKAELWSMFERKERP